MYGLSCSNFLAPTTRLISFFGEARVTYRCQRNNKILRAFIHKKLSDRVYLDIVMSDLLIADLMTNIWDRCSC